MKSLTALLLATLLFGCVKENIVEPKVEQEVQIEKERETNVTIGAHVWKHNYRLKYKRTSGWCDTLISSVNYTVSYQCYISDLNIPVTVTNVEIYDKDTLALTIHINTTIYDYFIVNKCEGQVSLIPNLAL